MLVKKSLSLVAIAALGFMVNGCNSSSTPTNSSLPSKKITGVAFDPVGISADDAEKTMMRVSKKLTVTYDDNTTKEYPLSYQVLAKMGDKIGSGTIGLMTDKNGNPIMKADGSKDISDGPDGNSLIHIGGKDYLITHMEERPGELYDTEVKVVNGKLKTINTKPVDLSAIGGTIINCASTKTSYGSHLGGEEDYSLNTRYADKNSPFYVDCMLDGYGTDISGKFNYFCSYVDGMQKYLLDTGIDKNNGYNGDSFSPYNYGYIVEVQPQADGTTKSAKHYVTGKYTPELAAMMPDGKTVYMSDDGTYKGLWKFVSDKKIDNFTANWEGTLYAAKLTQTSDKNGGAFTMKWIKLGHANDNELKKMIDSKVKLTDIFEIQKDVNGSCAAGFTKINEDSKTECLKLKSGKEKMAAFLETRKYAAYKGATIEFRKEEGMTYDADKNVLYVAMSQIKKSMEDNYKGQETTNDIRLPANQC
ncbi:alkaline phosphatase PhoX, partial [Sulfurovum sp.]|uniref:alkaline phosphatase PhoX n=1 Tax=Sulfurovum sp. TaxID=1969726 RepID=UPI0025E6B403